MLDGKYHDQFQVDWYQGGAGTSTNMNANEVLANIGLELGGHKKGEYQFLEPHDDLNMSQSTNDSYPTAIKVALHPAQRQADRGAASSSSRRSARRATRILEIVKMGRTELQDAVPMTVGQEFHAFAASLEGEIQLLKRRGEVSLRGQHGRDRHRQRHQRAEGLCREVRGASRQAHRQADRAGHGHARGDLGPAGIRRLFVAP